jgi:hypothetical protein
MKTEPVEVTMQSTEPAELPCDWRSLINQSWANDWSDPREDVYTPEDGRAS